MEIAKLNEINAALTASLPTADLNELSPVSGGLTKGFKGKVLSFGYNETTLPLQNDQKITVAGVEHIISAGEMALSLGFKFEDGSNVALSTIRRSALSSLGGKSTRAITAAELPGFIGKTFHVTDVQKDASTERTQYREVNGVQVERANVGKAYSIAVI